MFDILHVLILVRTEVGGRGSYFRSSEIKVVEMHLKLRRFYNKAKRSKNDKDRAAFRCLRKSVDKQIRKSHLSYVSYVIGASLDSGNAKPFWRYIKSQGQQMFGVAALSSHFRPCHQGGRQGWNLERPVQVCLHDRGHIHPTVYQDAWASNHADNTHLNVRCGAPAAAYPAA